VSVKIHTIGNNEIIESDVKKRGICEHIQDPVFVCMHVAGEFLDRLKSELRNFI